MKNFRSYLCLLLAIAGLTQNQPLNAMTSGSTPAGEDAEGNILYSIPLGSAGQFLLNGRIIYLERNKQFCLVGHLLDATDLDNPITGVEICEERYSHKQNRSHIYGRLKPIIECQKNEQATAFNGWLKKYRLQEDNLYFHAEKRLFHPQQPESLSALYQSFDYLLGLLRACTASQDVNKSPYKNKVSLLTLVGHEQLGTPTTHVYLKTSDRGLLFSYSATEQYLNQESMCIGQILRLDLYPEVVEWCGAQGINTKQPVYIHSAGGLDDSSLIYLSNNDTEYGEVWVNEHDTEVPVALRLLCQTLPLVPAQLDGQKERLADFLARQ